VVHGKLLTGFPALKKSVINCKASLLVRNISGLITSWVLRHHNQKPQCLKLGLLCSLPQSVLAHDFMVPPGLTISAFHPCCSKYSFGELNSTSSNPFVAKIAIP
jgi:hypothetical protein